MLEKLLAGPLLGIESNTLYTICFLTDQAATHSNVYINNKEIPAIKIQDTYSGSFWRAEFDLPVQQEAQVINYTIRIGDKEARDRHDRTAWKFHIPGETDTPKFAYASCNGFSSADLMTKTEDPYLLWDKMVCEHEGDPFSLLLMGGDQLYADEIWSRVPTLNEWGELPRKTRIKRKASKIMKSQIDRFYDELYIKRWSNKSMSLIFASIPSVMMWDDHDIFDGWGSYPKDLQNCDVYKNIFSVARKYFENFQIRTIHNRSLINAGAGHYSMAFKYREYNLLAIDNRAERSLKQVMSKQQWEDVINYLKTSATSGDMLLMSAVPVIYRDFSLTETVFDLTPWQEELTDDLKDHWRSKEHQGERARLIMNLLENVKQRQDDQGCKTVILSGDVHIGCVGAVRDRRDANTRMIHQVVSSGIVHPPPSRIQWFGIMAVTNDRTEYLNEDETIDIRMLKPFGSRQYIRSRSYVTLEKGTDTKLWINWVCELDDSPSFPLA
jgi:phosphodiesterase/alkaline phosphatase D-like protein